MKKAFLLVTIFFLLGSISSCQNNDQEYLKDESESLENVTDADVFIASEKYQNYLKEFRKDSRKMRNILSKLTKEDKVEYKRLLTLRPDNDEELDTLFSSISEILGINYKERIFKLAKRNREVFSSVDFTRLELLKAHQKFIVAKSTIARSINYDEAQASCRELCDLDFAAASYKCSLPEKPNEWQNIDWACMAKLESERNDCYDHC